MKLFADCVAQAEALLAACPARALPWEGCTWADAGSNQLIFRDDTACELGGGTRPAVSGMLLTEDAGVVPADQVLCIGPDLPELSGDCCYGRLTLLRVGPAALGEGSTLYRTIRRLDYTRYHLAPEGFMLRISSTSHRESARVSRKSLARGLDFARVGRVFLDAYHSHPEVEAVKLVFITQPDFPYDDLSRLVRRSEDITMALDHLAQKVKMDCDTCSLQKVCAEVEALTQQDFPQTP